MEEISDDDSVLDRIDYDQDESLTSANGLVEEGSSMPHTPPPPPILSESDRFFFSTGSQYIPDHKYSELISPSAMILDKYPTKINGKSLEISIPTVENDNTISIMEFFENPGRLTRPKRICIIIRGPPGSGKSYVAKLIKEKERNMGDDNLRILSIDDYFLIETETIEQCSKTGKKVFRLSYFNNSLIILYANYFR